MPMLIGMFARIIIFFHNVNMAFSQSYGNCKCGGENISTIVPLFSYSSLFFIICINYMIKCSIVGSGVTHIG